MKLSLKHAMLAAAAALCTGTAVNAAPLVNVYVLGSTDGGASNDWSSNVSVASGQTVSYEVVTQVSQTSVTNSTHPYTLSEPQTAGTDGINSLTVSLTDANKIALNPNLNDGWPTASGTGPVTGGSFVG